MAARALTMNVRIRWKWLLYALCLMGQTRLGMWLCVKVTPA